MFYYIGLINGDDINPGLLLLLEQLSTILAYFFFKNVSKQMFGILVMIIVTMILGNNCGPTDTTKK